MATPQAWKIGHGTSMARRGALSQVRNGKPGTATVDNDTCNDYYSQYND
jgi:hypothetical protein